MLKWALRGAFWVVAAAIGAVGLLAGATVVVVIAIVGATLGAGVGCTLADGEDGTSRIPDVLRYAACGGAGVLVTAGLVVMLGPLALPAVGLAAAALVWRHRKGEPSGSGRDLHRLSNAELGREWMRSHTRLRAARTADEMDRMTTLRRHQLDEIERRDAAGCREWLASGAWATSDSIPFLGI